MASALDTVRYDQARRLLLALGATALGAVVVTMVVRGVDPTEVWAAVLFVPIFLAFMAAGWIGGLVGAVLASVVYLVLRADAIDALGFGEFAGLVWSRIVGYAAFGVIGGIANQQLERSLDKLELYDEIDDATGLHNARAFLADIDLEMARAQRYRTFFSVTWVEVRSVALAAVGRRRRAATLADAGEMLGHAVRSVDRAAHGVDGDVHLFAVVLPETGPEGARVFGERLAHDLRRFLGERGADPGPLTAGVVSAPGDDEALAALRARFDRIDEADHPAHHHHVVPQP